MKKYRFDGYDAIVDENNDIVYDGLDKRAADVIASLLDYIESLEDKIQKLKNPDSNQTPA